MADLLRKIIYTIYGWQFTTVLICSLILLIIWTLLNAFVPKKICKAINLISLIVIIIAIGFFTVTNRSSNYECSIRLVPFIHYLTNPSGRETLWLNAFIFFPMGLSLPFLLPEKVKRKALVTILIADVFSICIESVQFVFKLGWCETDDVLMNTFGAMIGTVSFVIVSVINGKENNIN